MEKYLVIVKFRNGTYEIKKFKTYKSAHNDFDFKRKGLTKNSKIYLYQVESLTEDNGWLL